MVLDAAPTVAITGAYGYVGGVIRSTFLSAGCRAVALVRSPRQGDDARHHDLRSGVHSEAFEDVDVLVHCAYDLTLTAPSDIEEVNIGGTERLLAAARQAGVARTIVISSIAAYPGTRQRYGLAKLAIEDIARDHGAVVVRPGLVYGPNSGGMIGALKRLLPLPVIPVPSPTHQFLVHEQDLALAVSTLATTPHPPATPLVVAHHEPVALTTLMRGLMAERSRRLLLPTPWWPAYIALRTAERLGIRPPFRSDSLWGLAHPSAAPDQAPLSDLGLSVRAFAAGTA